MFVVSSDSPRSTCESRRSILHEASWQFWRMSPAKYRISLMRSASVAMRTSKHSDRLGNKSRGILAKVIPEMAGLADVSITLSVYGHILPDMQSTAADGIDEALG